MIAHYPIPEAMITPILKVRPTSPLPAWLPLQVTTALGLAETRPAAEWASRVMAAGDAKDLQELTEALPTFHQQHQAAAAQSPHDAGRIERIAQYHHGRKEGVHPISDRCAWLSEHLG